MTQLLKSLRIGRIVEPEMQIAITTIFLMKVLQSPLKMCLLIQFRIVFQSVLHGTANDSDRVYKTVCFRHYTAIE